jgi:hypothetical protein
VPVADIPRNNLVSTTGKAEWRISRRGGRSAVPIAEVLEYEHAERRRSIVPLTRLVYSGDQFRQRRPLDMRDFSQIAPEGIFKADAGLLSIDRDGMFDDRGFHQGTSEAPRIHIQ